MFENLYGYFIIFFLSSLYLFVLKSIHNLENIIKLNNKSYETKFEKLYIDIKKIKNNIEENKTNNNNNILEFKNEFDNKINLIDTTNNNNNNNLKIETNINISNLYELINTIKKDTIQNYTKKKILWDFIYYQSNKPYSIIMDILIGKIKTASYGYPGAEIPNYINYFKYFVIMDFNKISDDNINIMCDIMNNKLSKFHIISFELQLLKIFGISRDIKGIVSNILLNYQNEINIEQKNKIFALL